MALLPEQQLLMKSDECGKEFPFEKTPSLAFLKGDTMEKCLIEMVK